MWWNKKFAEWKPNRKLKAIGVFDKKQKDTNKEQCQNQYEILIRHRLQEFDKNWTQNKQIEHLENTMN